MYFCVFWCEFIRFSLFLAFISTIYPLEMELKETTRASNEVCYLDTRIKHEDDETPYHISVYDKRDDFNFQIVNFQFPYRQQHPRQSGVWSIIHISTGEVCQDLYIKGELHTPVPSVLVMPPETRL